MTVVAPPLDKRDAAKVVTQVSDALKTYGWHGQEGGAGWALVRLFGRLAELAINRLNQVPDKHFLAFLNEAGVTLLPPRAASTELTFTPAKDGPPVIRVPAGTQVATVQTETQPEVIFETQQDFVVAPSAMVKCIAFDPLNYSDRTAQAAGQASGPFAAFRGEQERERVLYLGDDELFTFADAASRKAAAVTLNFALATPGDHAADGWELRWLYWDGTDWVSLTDAGAGVADHTNGFSQDGNVELTNLPGLTATEVDGETHLWIACKLAGGMARDHLPVLRSIKGSRNINITSPQTATAPVAFSAIQADTTFAPLNIAGDFFPLGQRPGRLDTFYLMSDEAFSKQGATVKLEVADLVGVPEGVTSDDLNNLEIVWEYHSTDGWIKLGTSKRDPKAVTSSRLNFADKTLAFTKSPDSQDSFAIKFDVPSVGGNDPIFEKTTVNDQEGYWVRARLVAGSYNVPASVVWTDKEKGDYTFTESKAYAPLIKQLKVTYSGYGSSIAEKGFTLCRSQVDNMASDHTSALHANVPFAPFCSTEEGPALYLGFQSSFPAGEWIQLLLDVAEEVQTSGTRPILEYWNGSAWAALRVSDGSQGLSQRGYLGFFGPDDHQPSTEFGQNAYWLRARPPRSHPSPQARAGDDRTVSVEDDEAKVTLDASGSRAFACHTLTRYIWRRPLVADAGSDQTVSTTGDEATVYLDASGSQAAQGRPIVKYIWRRVEPQEEATEQEDRTAILTPYLKAIRSNTAPALNAVSIKNEVLGSSDGKPDQVFTLLRRPVLPDAQITVREPDRPPADELARLQEELQQVDEKAQALPPTDQVTPGEGVWVRWHQVPDFYGSTPYSRHFTLDPISGRVRFGDGKRGKIPPLGRDNIRALLYHTHDGAKGNAKAGAIAVLRNPSGDLANIKSVTNPEAAGGGSDAETVDEVRLRGPQTLKSRQRAVTIEDFVGLALEASGEVVQARCLPNRNVLGVREAGWVTVVITPESTAAKPTPSPALLRLVQNHLEDRALTNLKEVNHIFVKGPEYIEATVFAQVVPDEPEKADDIELAVLKRLETFLHPLQGGPERTGWELGRDVHLSEVCAEIEAVSGVDYVVQVRLQGSLQQRRLHVMKENERYRKTPFTVPVGSRVGTFDERIKLLLAEPLPAGADLARFAIYGFKVGDKVTIVEADNTVLKNNLSIAFLSGDRVTFVQSFDPPGGWDRRDALISVDGRLRLPLASDGVTFNEAGKVMGVTVQGFKVGDTVSIVAGGERLDFLPLAAVEPCEDRIFVPEGHLIYSGRHDIKME